VIPIQVLLAVQTARLLDDVVPWPVVLTVAILWTPWVVTAIAVWRLVASKGSGDDDSGPPGGGPGPRPDGTLQPGPGGLSICWPEFERRFADYVAESSGKAVITSPAADVVESGWPHHMLRHVRATVGRWQASDCCCTSDQVDR
jgi:hypothetical protein